MDVSESSTARRRGGRLIRVAPVSVIAGVVMGGGALVLAGWALRVSWLYSPIPGTAATVADTGMALLCGGLALLLIVGRRQSRQCRGVILVLVGVMTVIGGVTLAEYVSGLDLGVDRLLVSDVTNADVHPGRPSPQTAVAMILAAGGLLLLGFRAAATRAVELLVLAIALLCLVAIAGYMYEVPGLRGFEDRPPMPPLTAIAFLALAAGILLASGGRVVAAITGPRAGAIAARRLLPIVLVGLPVLALLRRSGQGIGLYDREEGVALLLLAQVALVSTGILVMARLLNIVDQQREEARNGLEHKVEQRTADLARSRLETVQRLARAAEYRDDDTYHHTERVGATSGLLAERLGCDADFVARVRRAAPLHDVGKLAIPDAILLKPGKLTDEEFEDMKAHTMIGAEILQGSGFDVLQLAERIALYHHERWDGTGYPMGLRAEEIPLAARIVAVADVFDALTHERPYKPAWSVADAVAEITRMAGSQFDPAIVACFLELGGTTALQPERGLGGAFS